VLLLDEPTASLDPKTGRRIEELVRRLGTRYAVLAVSHGLGQAARLADRAVVLREGRVAERLAGPELHDPARLQRLVEEVF
jgi:ABC-type phosphate transport system ATPase subunit